MAIPEIPALRQSIIEGRIDGSSYNGECACLCGTIEKTDNVEIKKRIYDLRDSDRPIERFFMNIRKGDKPETNQVSKIVLEWLDEFSGYVRIPINEAVEA